MGRYLMGAREIEDRLGVSRQRVFQLTSRSDWPKPYDELAMGKVWLITDVEAWIRAHRPELVEGDLVVRREDGTIGIVEVKSRPAEDE